jgi:hypothetical protein
LPPRVVNAGEAGVDVTSMGRTHRFPARWRACVTELARGRELGREELLKLTGGDRDVLRTFLVAASTAGLVLVRPTSAEIARQQS